MIHKRREKTLPPPLFSCVHIDFTLRFRLFLYPSDDLEIIHPFPSLVLSTPRSFSARFPSIPYL